MHATTIFHKLAFALSMIDGATGRSAAGRVVLYTDGKEQPYRMTPDGVALVMGEMPEKTELRIEMDGYEPETMEITLPAERNEIVTVEAELMPLDRPGHLYLTITGEPGEAGEDCTFDAVRPDSYAWTANEPDVRKRLLPVVPLFGGIIGGRHYALIDPLQTHYFPITVVKKTNENEYKLTEIPEGTVSGLQIARRVLGKTIHGAPTLKLPYDSDTATWLIRSRKNGTDSFKRAELKDLSDDPTTRTFAFASFGGALPQGGDSKSQEKSGGMKGG
jgi:hypothetical protein